MRKNVIVLILLVVCLVFTAALSDRFLTALNIENVLRRASLFGVISLGAVFVIVTGGIDLSIGSVVCLVGVMLPHLVVACGWPLGAALFTLLAATLVIGVAHGFCVARLRLQPFVVTLCGLLLYRGLARGITADQTQGFGSALTSLRQMATGRILIPGITGFALPAPVLIVSVLAILAGLLLHRTVWGRYLKAIGSNEQAARYSGLPVGAMIVSAYSLCAIFSALGGLLFVLDVNSAQPADFGNFFELYAVAAAVLGGCSLRGGEISITGTLMGATVMQVLRNALTLLDVPTQLEYAMIGGVLLLGVTAGEVLTQRVADLYGGWLAIRKPGTGTAPISDP